MLFLTASLSIFFSVSRSGGLPRPVIAGSRYCELILIKSSGIFLTALNYRGADKSLARPGRKQSRKHVRDARDFNNIEMRAVIRFLFLQGKAPKEIHAILTETLAWFLRGRAKVLSAPLYSELPVTLVMPGFLYSGFFCPNRSVTLL